MRERRHRFGITVCFRCGVLKSSHPLQERTFGGKLDEIYTAVVELKEHEEQILDPKKIEGRERERSLREKTCCVSLSVVVVFFSPGGRWAGFATSGQVRLSVIGRRILN